MSADGTILVTGGSRGIGASTATLLADQGHRVVIVDIAPEPIVGTTAILWPAPFDVASESAVVAGIADIEKAHGPITGLVNAAGVFGKMHTIDRVRMEQWDREVNIDLRGTFLVTRSVGIAMAKRRHGAIVNVASVAAFNASPDSASYAASKAAVVAYTRSLAYAHGADGIRANAVAPGWVRTPMSAYEMQLLADQNGTTPDVEFHSVERRIALGRMAEPAEIAACCLFLASDEASFVTGAVLVADGGGRSPTQNRAV